jgi:hypothetical protein
LAPPPLFYLVMFFVVVIVMAEVNTEVEFMVIPIRFMILTPLAVFLHSVDVRIDLAAMFAMAGSVAVNPGSIRVKPPMAIFLPISVRSSGPAESQYEPAC